MNRRWFVAVAATLATGLAVMAAAAAPRASRLQDVPLEDQFVAAINDARRDEGLDPLAVYADLTDDARAHTAQMIEAGRIFHSDRLGGYTTGWSLLGENVGLGPDMGRLHDAFMASPTHRKNVLDEFDRIGVGADRNPDGIIYVTVLFMQTDVPDPATLELRRPVAEPLALTLVGFTP